MEGMTDLSPAAQAVYDAYCQQADNPCYYEHSGLVAALRAAADQVVPEGYDQAYDCCLEIMSEIRDDLLAIANELEQFE
jgi:hypothetical protein